MNRPTVSGVEARVDISTDEPSDAELTRRVADGDRGAAAVLVGRYESMVRRFLLRLTCRPEAADDLAQDTFVRMLQHAGRYDARYPMRTWLLTIARRLSINRGRRESRQVTSEHIDGVADGAASPDELAAINDERAMLRVKLDGAMAQLSDPQRQAVLLFHQHNLCVQEVAAVMGVPEGTVKSHLHRGRAAMRKFLQANGGVNA